MYKLYSIGAKWIRMNESFPLLDTEKYSHTISKNCNLIAATGSNQGIGTEDSIYNGGIRTATGRSNPQRRWEDNRMTTTVDGRAEAETPALSRDTRASETADSGTAVNADGAFRVVRRYASRVPELKSSLLQAVRPSTRLRYARRHYATLLTCASAITLSLTPTAQAREELPIASQKISFEISEATMVRALMEFTRQSGLQLAFPTAGADNLAAPAVVGEFTPKAALDQLLRNSGLEYEFANERTISVHAAGTSSLLTEEALRIRVANASPEMQALENARPDIGREASEPASAPQPPASDAGVPLTDGSTKGIPEILVKGSRSLNMDIRRSENDVQPYVTFDREEISRSHAPNLEDFLKTRLPMNTASQQIDQIADTPSDNSGGINLRGLGANQTLILVDGRRVPGVTRTSGDFGQPDISGIPISSIERIEVLPATASGIYGGSATGGVVNIIRRKDYSGLEVGAQFGNAFSGDVASRQVYVNGGANFRSGETRVVFSASNSKVDPLLVSDRDFLREARERAEANGSNIVSGSSFGVDGATSNVCAALVFGPTFGFCDGSTLTLDSGQSLGASITHVPVGYRGTASDGGAALLANAGHYNLDAPRDDRELLRAPEKSSISFGLRQDLGSAIEVFLDASASHSDTELSSAGTVAPLILLEGDAPENPFQESILIDASVPGLESPGSSKSEQLQVAAGLVTHLPNKWAAAFETNWSRSRGEFRQLIGGGGISSTGLEKIRAAALSDLNAFPVQLGPSDFAPTDNYHGGPFSTILRDTTLRVSGPGWRILPAGPLNVTALVEHRKEEALNGYVDFEFQTPPSQLYPHRSQETNSYYLEAHLPILGQGQLWDALQGFELQGSVRHDDYKTRSTSDRPGAETRDDTFPPASYFTNRVSSTDYTVGFRFAPLRFLALRASAGTGFLPPTLNQIAPVVGVRTSSVSVNDPLRGNTDTYVGVPFTIVSGGNEDLLPEESESWSAGLILSPEFLGSFRMSVDFTRIRKKNEFYFPSFDLLVANESLFPGRITRGEKLPTDPADWAGPITQVDTTYINLSSASSASYDFQIEYALKTERYGGLQFSAIATRFKELTRQLTPVTDAFDSVGFNDGPLRWRGAASLGWDYRQLSLVWNAQYFGGYSIAFAEPSLASLVNEDLIGAQGSADISKQTYHDFLGQLRFDKYQATVSFGVQNVFDSRPPIVVSTILGSSGPYGYSVYGDPRLRRYTISFQKRFGS